VGIVGAIEADVLEQHTRGVAAVELAGNLALELRAGEVVVGADGD
jgi:hypothetical protein